MRKKINYFVKRDGLLGFDWRINWKEEPKIKEYLSKTKEKIRRLYDIFLLFK
jgi:hypothetical protein|tara:strand:- start:554 stop:709 length:156 start_codon:yes stop_codon:yes gene_type:complete